MMNNTIKFALWFLAMMTLTIGFLFTTAGPTFATIDLTVRMEQSIVPQASFASTSDDHFWSLLVAKSARSMKEVPPFRVGRHYITTEKSLWTLSVEQRHHYTMCVVLFDMMIIAVITTVLTKATNQWAAHLLAIVEAAVETAKRAKELAEAPKITAEETHPLASQDEIPTKETRPLVSLLKEAKGEIACLSTAMCVSEECQQSEVMPEEAHDDNDEFQLNPMLMGQFIDVALLPPIDTNWCERVKNQRQEEEEEQDQEDSSIDDAEEWVVLEDLRGRHAGPEEAPLNPMTMGQFFDVADLPPVYDQQLQAVLSRLPAALLNATDLSEGGMWATLA
ncbi:uncharacterized protein ACA1_275610 [Acanthamoeba castellanii str. Neff]|uniref:Transmembrane protein n=1 Tax=Acanthamoeba castellanii (strain ATCC 30010 / Neff) TaxID=1257118 RepID=L8GR19_ACACF|nr:uncharacterized protein ACA1_275610 [Acanthamoeba castellanii str. Neff]ELR15387.1 hypothetical protein ACA1_275610 [Acanthamoeba castellanii str. Neff]